MWPMLRTLLIAGYFGFFLTAFAGLGHLWHGRMIPDQPIAFSHVQHAGILALPCTFCHIHVENSPQAGVPPLEICMSCHQTIAVDRPEIRKLTRHWEEGQPIYWERVYAVPDFILFNHKRHVRQGVECTACHGAVAQMEVVYRVVPLEMGWCVSCHRSWQAPTDCMTCHR
jgi:hypothetical protein